MKTQHHHQGKHKKHLFCWAKRVQRSAFAIGVALSILGLQGCAFFETAPVPPIYLKEVSFSLDTDANNNSAVPIDILLIYDADMLKILLELEAKDYYSIAKQIKQDYPDLADILHWELTPGQVIKNYPISLRSKMPDGAILFAHYYVPGPNRIRIGDSESITVHFKANDFCIVEQGCFGADGGGGSGAALKANFAFSGASSADPAAAIASMEAAKAAQGNEELQKKFAKQVAKFKPKK